MRHSPFAPQTAAEQTAPLTTSPVVLLTSFQVEVPRFSGIAHLGTPGVRSVPPPQGGRDFGTFVFVELEVDEVKVVNDVSSPREKVEVPTFFTTNFALYDVFEVMEKLVPQTSNSAPSDQPETPRSPINVEPSDDNIRRNNSKSLDQDEGVAGKLIFTDDAVTLFT